jgi:hypothetical protein
MVGSRNEDGMSPGPVCYTYTLDRDFDRSAQYVNEWSSVESFAPLPSTMVDSVHLGPNEI